METETNENGMGWKVATIVIGVLLALATALIGWNLRETIRNSEEVIRIRGDVKVIVREIERMNDRQDRRE